MKAFYPVIAAALCVVAILVDFTSSILSVAVDGIILAGVLGIIYNMSKA